MIYSEGTVERSRNALRQTLNYVAQQIGTNARRQGLDTEVYLLKDVTEDSKQAVIEIQLGHNALFNDSQVAEVVVFDEDNIRINLPVSLANVFNFKEANFFKSVSDVVTFLDRIYDRL